MTGEVLLKIGIIVTVTAIAAIVVFVIISFVTGKRLKRTLDKEYGEKEE